MALTRESVIEALKTIQGPKGQDIVTGGEVRALDVGEKDVRFVLEIDQALADEYSKIKDASEVALKKLGASEVSVVLTAHASQKAPPDLKPNRKSEPKGPEKIPGVDRVLAVASGKGGVGKSTVSSILPALWQPKAGALVCWMPMFMGHPNQECLESQEGLPVLMEKLSSHFGTTALL